MHFSGCHMISLLTLQCIGGHVQTQAVVDKRLLCQVFDLNCCFDCYCKSYSDRKLPLRYLKGRAIFHGHNVILLEKEHIFQYLSCYHF